MNSVGPLARTSMSGRGRRRTKASENVAAQIVTDIVERQLQAGANLPAEAAMMLEYGAGRGTIREALRLLEVHGLISIKTGPTGGPIVSAVTSAAVAQILSLYLARMNVTFADLNDARHELEPLAVRSAAAHADAARATTLRDTAEAGLGTDPGERRYVTECAAFHETVVSMWDNPVLCLLTGAIIELLAAHLGPTSFTPQRGRPRILAEHKEIAEAIGAGRVDEAEATMRAHLRRTRTPRSKDDPLHQPIDWISGESTGARMKAAERVAREILRDLGRDGLTPGTRLPPEVALTEQYGVARPTLREALRILEIQGLIEIRAGLGGGPSVGEVSAGNFASMLTLYLSRQQVSLRDIYEAHIVLDSVVTRLAAERARTADRAAIEDALGLMDSVDHDQPRFVDASRSFHNTIALLCGNPVLDLFARGLNFIVAGLGAVTPPELRRTVVVDAHQAIAEEVRTGDGERAAKEMRRHLETVLSIVETEHRALLRSPITWI